MLPVRKYFLVEFLILVSSMCSILSCISFYLVLLQFFALSEDACGVFLGRVLYLEQTDPCLSRGWRLTAGK